VAGAPWGFGSSPKVAVLTLLSPPSHFDGHINLIELTTDHALFSRRNSKLARLLFCVLIPTFLAVLSFFGFTLEDLSPLQPLTCLIDLARLKRRSSIHLYSPVSFTVQPVQSLECRTFSNFR
jgi:hypothetical protein